MGRFFSRLLDKMDTRWSLAERLGIGAYFAATFGIPAWGAWMTNFLQQYSPISWIAAGFLGVLIASVVALALAWFRRHLIRANIERRFYDTADRINPLNSVFENRRILISDLLPPVGVEVVGKTFINCEIIGPANIVFTGQGAVTNCHGALVDSVLSPESTVVYNAIHFINCNFQRCKLFKITFIVPESAFEKFDAGGLGNWISIVPKRQD